MIDIPCDVSFHEDIFTPYVRHVEGKKFEMHTKHDAFKALKQYRNKFCVEGNFELVSVTFENEKDAIEFKITWC